MADKSIKVINTVYSSLLLSTDDKRSELKRKVQVDRIVFLMDIPKRASKFMISHLISGVNQATKQMNKI